MENKYKYIEIKKSVMDDVVHRIVKLIHPQKVVLFGSRARGKHKPSSDIDLLVIADSKEPRHRRSAPLYRALSDIIIPMDILVYSPKEVQEWSQTYQAFVTTAIREGKVLYEKKG